MHTKRISGVEGGQSCCEESLSLPLLLNPRLRKKPITQQTICLFSSISLFCGFSRSYINIREMSSENTDGLNLLRCPHASRAIMRGRDEIVTKWAAGVGGAHGRQNIRCKMPHQKLNKIEESSLSSFFFSFPFSLYILLSLSLFLFQPRSLFITLS